MPRIDHAAELRALVAVRGHPFDRTAFDRLFEGMAGISATMVDQPAAALLMTPEGMADFDVLVLYDMPGVDFAAAEDRPGLLQPSAALKDGMRRLLGAGKGVVALHHALAGWPTWDEYGDWLGGRFLYKPGLVRGEPRPDSGYRHDITHTLRPVAPHPVTAGLPDSFTLTDELYLAETFESDIIPLLRSDHAFDDRGFWSAAAAVNGRMFDNEGWVHPPGSNIVGWVKRALASPLVYLQPGDGPSVYDDPNYRRLVENAIRWAASPEALDWARSG
ncbi:ThuA domain-containing protein [Sphingomonas jatrophae]|uniref:ThuA-like domain-containing protein n=1 Tax=Sphingomonas jatrophae TaxID=1166337 RepID=A0A1I6M3W7_9SPHN|nr:ThuA domain-containing protein [Sphingomonas jatrophae]SFS10328.1 hypothetical protein SAMN05192580_3401 [Sphingomonas jatrophae]